MPDDDGGNLYGLIGRIEFDPFRRHRRRDPQPTCKDTESP